MSKLVLSKLVLFVLHFGICGSFHNKATISASALLCVLWQNLNEDSFDMHYTTNYCWAAIPDPIWMANAPYERKMNMLSSTDNNFIICLFDFERFSIVEPRYNEVLGTMKITLLYQVSHYIRVTKQRNIKSWDQQNYLVKITGFCYIRPLNNEVPLYWISVSFF